VHGVVEVGDQPPDLDRAELGRRGDVVGAERLSIDEPALQVVDVSRLESEGTGGDGLVGGQGLDRGERVGHDERIVDILADHEAHDLGQIAVAEVVEQRHG
jgi:hypothetical protein